MCVCTNRVYLTVSFCSDVWSEQLALSRLFDCSAGLAILVWSEFTEAEPEAQSTQRPIDLLRLTITCHALHTIWRRKIHESNKEVAGRTLMAVMYDTTWHHPTCIRMSIKIEMLSPCIFRLQYSTLVFHLFTCIPCLFTLSFIPLGSHSIPVFFTYSVSCVPSISHVFVLPLFSIASTPNIRRSRYPCRMFFSRSSNGLLEGLSSTVTFGDFLTPSQIDQGQPGATTGELWWCSKRNPGSGLTKLFIALGWGLFNLRSSKYVQSWKTSCPPSCDFAWVSDMKHKDPMGPWRVQVAASLPNDSCTQSCSGMKSCWIQLITWNRPTDPH